MESTAAPTPPSPQKNSDSQSKATSPYVGRAGSSTRSSSSSPAGRGKGQEVSMDSLVKEILSKDPNAAAAEAQKTQEAMEIATQSAPLVKLVYSILRESIKRGASDIHIEPFEENLRVRFRVDGVLQEIQKLPSKLIQPIVSRIKIMGDLDIVERRIPQDGCIRLRTTEGEEADFRVNVLPSVFGEKVVLRVLGKTNLNNDLSKVGLPPDQLQILRNCIAKPDGLVLVTGPTGSGKTTTLYAALNELNDITTSVFTAEDPVEGTIPGITQVQVNEAVGLNFASILRSLLRQDPDVILVGEIRDYETVEIAVKASLTGHLVLSTLHTNDACSTIHRLLNMGVEPYLIASALNLIVAQRLVRKICTECKEVIPANPNIVKKFGLQAGDVTNLTIYHGKGCDHCGRTGYKGRTPIYEMLSLNDDLRDMILNGASTAELRKAAKKFGMTTLRGAGIRLIKEGISTLEEVLGSTNEDSE